MRYFILFLSLFISGSALAQNIPAPQVVSQEQKVLIQKIQIEGFIPQDKDQFAKLFKPYRNQHLSSSDMQAILGQIQEIYEQAGYQGLVSIEYHVHKRQLVYKVSLIK